MLSFFFDLPKAIYVIEFYYFIVMMVIFIGVTIKLKIFETPKNQWTDVSNVRVSLSKKFPYFVGAAILPYLIIGDKDFSLGVYIFIALLLSILLFISILQKNDGKKEVIMHNKGYTEYPTNWKVKSLKEIKELPAKN